MSNSVIKKSAYLDYVILDKEATVSERVELKGSEIAKLLSKKIK